MIHYHGTPITPDVAAIEALRAGHAFVSFNRPDQLGVAVEVCQSFAIDNGALDCALVLLAQLSRDVEKRTDKRPMLSDLRDAGQIEQDADGIVMLYREKYYDPETEMGDVAEMIIAKQRDGATGVVPVEFRGETIEFVDYHGPWPITSERKRGGKGGFGK